MLATGSKSSSTNSSALGWIFYKQVYLSFGKDCGNASERNWEEAYSYKSKKGTIEAYDECLNVCNTNSGYNGFSMNNSENVCYLKSIKDDMCKIPANASPGWSSATGAWIFYKKK